MPLTGVIRRDERGCVVEQDKQGPTRVNRINYEMAVLQTRRERVRYKELWVPGARCNRNPDDDFPTDFAMPQTTYCQALDKPRDLDTFITSL